MHFEIIHDILNEELKKFEEVLENKQFLYWVEMNLEFNRMKFEKKFENLKYDSKWIFQKLILKNLMDNNFWLKELIKKIVNYISYFYLKNWNRQNFHYSATEN
jgi:hypothetical protein